MKVTRRDTLALAVGATIWPSLVNARLGRCRRWAIPNRELALFDKVWVLVRDKFFDPRLHGIDWLAMRARFREEAASARSIEEAAVPINTMLAALGASHTHLYTAEDPAFYELADITLEQQDLRRVFPKGVVSYPGVGIFTDKDERGRFFITGVVEGNTGHNAGLLRGDEILSVGGYPFHPLQSFRGKVGHYVPFRIRRTLQQDPTTIYVVPEELYPNAMFLRSVTASARLIVARNGFQIGYVHMWSYARPSYQSALEDLVASRPLQDADGLVLDLRDGWGGARPQYLDLFNQHVPSMLTTGRNGEREVYGVKWRKPVAMLINGGTRSGKEVLAFGFKAYGIGDLIGSRTAGSLLGATAFSIDQEALLLLAVENVHVDGQPIEGVGVSPTIEVPFDFRYSAGHDPQLDRAVEVLSMR